MPRLEASFTIADKKVPPLEKMVADRVEGRNGSLRRNKFPITATSYTVASLQTATNSFCQESLIGEGSIGRVYIGDLNGKVNFVHALSLG